MVKVKKTSTRKLGKLSEKAVLIISVPVLGSLFGGMIWIISRGDVDSYIFWIVAAIEVSLAYVTMTLRRREFVVVIWMAAILVPYFVYLGFRLPLKMVWLVYILAVAILGVYSIFKPLKRKTKFQPLGDTFIIPRYLPPGYKEAERKTHKRKDNRILEIIFDSDDDEHIIWLMESEKPFPDEKPMKNSETTSKTINGVPVHINQEILKNQSKPNDNECFVEVNWQYKGLYFNLRSDGLLPEEVEKIIDSLTKSNE